MPGRRPAGVCRSRSAGWRPSLDHSPAMMRILRRFGIPFETETLLVASLKFEMASMRVERQNRLLPDIIDCWRIEVCAICCLVGTVRAHAVSLTHTHPQISG